MEQAQDSYEIHGIEPDEAIAKEALAKNLPVRCGFFPDALNDDDIFDIIIFNDVLEHIPDAPSILNYCHKHLSSNGHVIINAPDSDGFLYRTSKWIARMGFPKTFERMWQLGLPSPHLYYFNTQTITDLAKKTKFSLVSSATLSSITTESLTQRIKYAAPSSELKSKLLALSIIALMPLIKISKPDIQAWLLKKQQE